MTAARAHGIGEHPRSLGWLGTTALAMGGSNQSLFLIGALFASQGTSAVPLLAFGLLLAWMAIPGWIELIMMWPNRVGGIAATCAEAFRPYSPVLANLTGMCYWWGWIPTCGLTALLSASALHAWYLPGVPIALLATLIVGAFTALNLAGVRWVARFAVPMASAAALLALLSALGPALIGRVDWHEATSYHLTSPFHGVFGSITSAMAGLYLIGFAAPAFEAAACHVGETKNAVKNVPRAMFASALMASIYFIVLPVVWLGALGSGPLEGDLAHTLGPTFAPFLGPAAGAAAVWFMVFNMFHGTLQPLAGAARTLSQLAEDGLLPRVLALRMRRTDAPWVATLLTATMSVLFLLTGDPTWVLAAANLTYLIGIGLPSVAVWLLRRNEPARERPWRAPRGTIVLGVIAAMAWGVSTVLGFQQFGLPTVLAGIGLAYSGSALYLARVMADRRREGKPMLGRSLHVKLTGAMLSVLVLDGTGYLIAVGRVDQANAMLVTVLEDIFVAVALLTISVGLILPGLIGHALGQVAGAADRLAAGTLADLTAAMRALAAGDLEGAHARVDITPISVQSRDELGEMAKSFNVMQEEIGRTATALGEAREGLRWANDTLARLSRQNELLLSSAGEGIFGLDADGLITFVNPEAARLVEWPAADLVGRPLHETVHHTRVDGTHFDVADCPTIAAVHGELRPALADDVYWTRTGAPVPVHATATPIHEDGEVVGAVIVVRELSEQRRLEDQLRQSQKMEAVGQLAGGVAHDFNNLLTAISGYSTFALDRAGEDAELRSDIEQVQDAARRATDLTGQLLAFSRQQVLRPQVIEPNDCVANLLKLVDRVVGDDVLVATQLAATGAVKADPTQLEQVLMNLCVNARDAMPGGGTVFVSTDDAELAAAEAGQLGVAGGSYVVLSVADEGTGMDEQTAQHVFEPFFTTKDPGHGTGLGLATVYGIVSQSGGAIGLETAPGVGTTFRIYLPAAVRETGNSLAPEHDPVCPTGAETVLLVEDEDVVRGLVRRMLEDNGHTVLEAATPQAALVLAGEPFDILVTDVIMPQMNGAVLAATLQKRRPDLRVLYMSGYTAEAITNRGVLPQGTRFLQKPFGAAELARAVREALDGVRLAA